MVKRGINKKKLKIVVIFLLILQFITSFIAFITTKILKRIKYELIFEGNVAYLTYHDW
jgi:uncharacterized membrane protein YjjP (DUF1212 family)